MKLITQIALTLALISLSLSARAIEPFKIKEIMFEGLQRVEPSNVINYLPVKIGDTANDDNIRASIQSLFSSGLFADVTIRQNEGKLIVRLEERPFVASVSFSGNKEFDADELKKTMKEMGLVEGRVYDKAIVARAEQEIKRMYLARSKYGLKVTTVSSPLDRNRVSLRMELDEGEVARIKQIRILGNKKFTQTELLDQLSQRTPGWMTWFTRSDRYAKEKLNADAEQLRSFYLGQGFFEFAIESNQVTLSPDRQDVYITIVISEGEQFKFASVDLKTQNPDQLSAYKKLIDIKTGAIFEAEKLNRAIKLISEKMGEEGYATAQVNAIPSVNYEARTVGFEVVADTGPRNYVRKINIVGNTRTRDSVVRREIRQLESAVYDSAKIKSSRDRIDRLGFFKEVNVDSSPVEGRSDQIDLLFTLVEKATGSLNFGVGYNSTDKIGITAGISQDNIFGSGNNLNFNINTSKSARSLVLSTTDPYYTDSGISRSFDLYFRTDKQTENGHNKADIATRGLAARFGFPVSDLDTIYVGGGAEYTGITTYANYSPQRYLDLNSSIGGSATYPLLTASWARDSRDSALSPNNGLYHRASAEIAAGSEIAFSKLGYQFQAYKPLNRDYTLAFNVDAGIAGGFKGKNLPFFKNYYVGGIGSVRGYQGGSLGPTELNSYTSTTDHVGGAKKLILNSEFLLPVPGTGKDRSARLFVFADGGYSWAESKAVNFSDLRYSAGFGLSWLSPIGPLKFSYAFPTKKLSTDSIQKFQFQIGTGF